MKKSYYSYFCKKKKSVNYQEILADSEVFEKFYEMENGKEVVCVPAGGVDLQCLWQDGKMSIIVCGSVDNGKLSAVNGSDKCFGARFKAGKVPETIRRHIGILMNNRIPLEQIQDTALLEKYMKEDLLLEQKADIMLQLFEYSVQSEENMLVSWLIHHIEKQKGHVVVGELVEETGYSHRYVNHVFKKNMGCSIKRFAGIERMQASIQYLLEQRDDEIYSELGYYDQAHFIKDFKKFTTVTPNSFKKDSEKLAMM